jgi:hypothetical protein
MKRYITNRAESIKSQIENRIKEEFETEIFDLFYDGGWYVRIVIDENDIIEYNVIMDEKNVIDFEIRE